MNIKSEEGKKKTSLVLMVNFAHGKGTQLNIKSFIGNAFLYHIQLYSDLLRSNTVVSATSVLYH